MMTFPDEGPLSLCRFWNFLFPGGSTVKQPTCNAGDVSLIPGSGRSPGGRHGNSLQYSCLEESHGQRSLVGYSPWGCKESDTTNNNKCLGRGPQSWDGRASGALGGTAARGRHCGDAETDRPGQRSPALHTQLWLPGSPVLPPPSGCPVFPALPL